MPGYWDSTGAELSTRIVDLSDPGALRVLDEPALPYVMQAVEGNRGFAVAPDAPNVLATLDLSRPDRPQPLGSHAFDDVVQAVAADGDRVYVLTRGGHARLHVLRGVESGLLTETGSVVVDPLASRVLAMGPDVIVTYEQVNIHAPARWGLQLVAFDTEDRPRIADMIQLPDLIGVPAADPPYLYVPAEGAGFVVLRVD